MPSISVGAGLALAGGIGGIGAIGGAALQSSAAENAAQTQASAADQAAQLQYQAEQNALGFQKQVFGTQQQEQQPFLQAGQGAVNALAARTMAGGKPDTTGSLTPTSLTQPWATPFTAPTAAQAAQYPGYQFQLQQGEQALQRSAAASGNLLSGGTAKDIEQYGQGLAQSDYQNVYNQALGQYQQGYNIFQNNQANSYNRLASLAGLGQTSAAQLGQQGSQAANINANTTLGTASQIGQQINNAAAARASGYVGSANAYSGALNNVGNLASELPLFSALNNSSNAAAAGIYNALPAGTTLFSAGDPGVTAAFGGS